MNRGSNMVSFGHSRLTEWADRRDALGSQSISTIGRMFKEGAGAACQAEGLHGDPTMTCQLRDSRTHWCESAVHALKEHDEDTWAAVMAHYLHGYLPGQIASGLGVEPRRGRDLLECGQAWIGSWIEQREPRESKSQDVGGRTGTDG